MPPSQYVQQPFDLSKLRALTPATIDTPAPRGNTAKDSLIAFDWSVQHTTQPGALRMILPPHIYCVLAQF